MNLDKISPGSNIPSEFNTVIEIPAYSTPVKYEVDKDSGALFVDRFIGTAMQYPANYGFIPNTLAEDGDPTDVLVVTPFPVVHGSVVKCRSIGVLLMEDESGIDAKILAVPTTKTCSMYSHINTIDDLPPLLIEQIKHFFEHYKDLEKGKWVKIAGWANKQSADDEIVASIKRFQK